MRKTAIVTGGSRGIGFGIALELAKHGYNIAILDVNDLEDPSRPDYKENMAKLEAAGAEYLYQKGDTRTAADRESFVKAVVERFGEIDVLVNNAGVVLSNDQLAQDVTEEEWDRVVDTDYKAVFFLTQRVAEIMIKQERGNIINIASVVARVASTRMLPYASAKAAVVQMTRCMAFEWARFNIRANCICPGYIETNMTQTTLNKPAAYEAITRPIPHNRKVGDPLDIAAAALFLGCDCSDMVNGTPLYVDGARSIW